MTNFYRMDHVISNVPLIFQSTLKGDAVTSVWGLPLKNVTHPKNNSHTPTHTQTH